MRVAAIVAIGLLCGSVAAVTDADRVRVWRVATLKEKFRVYVDTRGSLRCDHSIHFLGLPVLRLHYKMFRS